MGHLIPDVPENYSVPRIHRVIAPQTVLCQNVVSIGVTENRVDRRNVEPRAGLHENQPRLQALLRRDLRRTLPRRPRPPLRTGLRPPPRARTSSPNHFSGRAQDGLRQQHERPLPGTCPDDYIDGSRVMVGANWHTYQVLTKRSDRLENSSHKLPVRRCAPHIWWGVSVEDKKYGLPRIDHLDGAGGRAIPLHRTFTRRPRRTRLRAFIGSSSAEKATRRATDGATWVRSIKGSARARGRSSSSNGAAFINPRPAARCTAEPTTKCQSRQACAHPTEKNVARPTAARILPHLPSDGRERHLVQLTHRSS